MRLMLTLAAASLLVGCGGIVVMEAAGGGGFSGEELVGSGAAGGVDDAVCLELCDALAPTCREASECRDECREILSTQGCGAEARALVACTAQELTEGACFVAEGLCSQQRQAFVECGCGDVGSCSQDGDTCSCATTCKGKVIEAECNADGSVCDCERDGSTFQCESGEGTSPSCTPTSTCCGPWIDEVKD
jgi:hypothetical protein